MVQIVAQIQIKAEKKIQSKFVDIRSQKIALRELRTQLRDTFNNDKDYHVLDLTVKDQKMKLKTIKQSIENKNPSVRTLMAKIEIAKDNLKSHQLTLSDWLIEYKEKTGNTTIPDDKGEIVEFEVKKVAKVKKI